MSPFDGVLLASCLFDIAVFVALFWLAADHAGAKGLSTVSPTMFLTTLLMSVGIVAVKTVAFAVLGVHLFGLIHILYLDIAIVAPTIAVLICVSRYFRIPGVGRIRFGHVGGVAAMMAMLLVPVCLYASYFEPFNLKTEHHRIEVAGLPQENSPITIAVLADLQFEQVTSHERRAIDLAMEADPDIILIPGDVFQGTERQFREQESAIKSLLSKLEAPGGVYLVSGDCDRLNLLMRAIEGSKIKFIDGQVINARVGESKITIAGIPINYRSAAARNTLRQLSQRADRSDVALVLVHRPGVTLLPEMPDDVDLIVAGHTHGGQIQIPGFGPPITLSAVPRDVGAGGLSLLNNRNVYVSRGVGCERGHAPRIRFFCPPEVSILTLAPKVSRAPQHLMESDTGIGSVSE